MRSLLILALILFATPAQSLAASRAEVLVETLRKTAKPGNGIAEEEQKIAKKVQFTGPAAIPYLLRLLRDKNEDVRDLAAFTLSDMKGLTEEHLDALIESQRRDDGWIPHAIARIGTPRAIAFLVEELVRKRQTQNQVDGAIEWLGEKAVPDLVKIYQNDEGWDDDLENALASVLRGIGKRAVSAIDPLLKIANDETASPGKRARVISAIGSIGLAAERAVPNLVKLQQDSNEKVRAAVEFAMLRIGSVEAAAILVRMLEHAAEPFGRKLLVRDIAALKTRGKSAGPALAKYLADEDWDVRVGAARALGYIGYEDGANALIKLLARTDDWRLVLSAAESLGRLRAKEARPALAQISKEHWYPPVRAAAADASRTIRSGVTGKVEDPAQHFPSEFFGYEHAGEKMESLEYDDAKSLRFPIAAHQHQLVAVTVQEPGKAARREQWVGVEVEDGNLAGSNHGEWGGEIGFIDGTGKPQIFATENTEAIYKTEHGIFAVTGLAHMSMNHGIIFKLSKGADGAWTAEKWRALPGAPHFSLLLADGKIFVSCYGGMVMVSPDGSMKSLTRGEAIKGAARLR